MINFPRSVASAGRGQAPPATPLKARFASADGSELITVVSSESSKVRPTFLQACQPAATCQSHIAGTCVSFLRRNTHTTLGYQH